MTSVDQERVARAAASTIAGRARVRISRRPDPDDGFAVELVGIVDFDADLCVLEGGESMVFAGSDAYSLLSDGRWLLTQGQAGQRGLFDPRLLLELLSCRKTQSTRRLGDGSYAIRLDHGTRSQAQITPVSDAFELSVGVVIGSNERVEQITERVINADGGYRLEVVFALTPIDNPATISPPPPGKVITEDAYLAETGLL